MITSDIQARIDLEEDYINLKRFDFSLQKLLERYPEGCPTKVIANALMLTEAEVEELYEQTVKKLQELMGVKK